MSLIVGKWYPKDSSSKYLAHLKVDGSRYEVEIMPNEQSSELNNEGQSTKDFQAQESQNAHKLVGQWSNVTINDRLGNTERKLTLADGSLFTTHDNDAVDSIINHHKSGDTGSQWNLLLHRHETKMTSVLIMLVITVVLVVAFVKWGLPWTSQTVAHALPQKTGEYIGKQSLEVIDRYFLEPSKISDAEQQKIISRFNTRLKPFGSDDRIKYNIHFRDMSINGESLPNAFALPSGDIILTDKFVQLSENDDEIDAVLLHEMGHVVERHSLEMLTQNSLTTMIVMLVLGNPDGISELATGLGTALVSNHYSRQHETEADEYAFKKMLQVGIHPKSFVDILSRMEDYSTAVMEGEDLDDTQNESEESTKTQFSDFLSTHPNTQTRIEMADKYSQCFEQGLKVCEVQ